MFCKNTHSQKKIENSYKTAKFKDEEISSVDPDRYAKRFKTFMIHHIKTPKEIKEKEEKEQKEREQKEKEQKELELKETKEKEKKLEKLLGIDLKLNHEVTPHRESSELIETKVSESAREEIQLKIENEKLILEKVESFDEKSKKKVNKLLGVELGHPKEPDSTKNNEDQETNKE